MLALNMGVTVSRRSAAGGALRQPLHGVYPASLASSATWAGGWHLGMRLSSALFALVREDDVVWNVAGTYMWCVPDPRRSVPTPKHIKRVRILRLPPPGSLVGHPYSPHHRYACTRPVTVWPVRSPGTEVVTLNIECTPHGTDFFSGTEGRAMQPTAGAAS